MKFDNWLIHTFILTTHFTFLLFGFNSLYSNTSGHAWTWAINTYTTSTLFSRSFVIKLFLLHLLLSSNHLNICYQLGWSKWASWLASYWFWTSKWTSQKWASYQLSCLGWASFATVHLWILAEVEHHTSWADKLGHLQQVGINNRFYIYCVFSRMASK